MGEVLKVKWDLLTIENPKICLTLLGFMEMVENNKERKEEINDISQYVSQKWRWKLLMRHK